MKYWLTLGIVMILWIFFLPREQIEFERHEIIMINPYSVPETLSIDPTWVKPLVVEHSVTITIYHAVEGQTDSTPNELADGTKIDLSKAGSYRYCALSRDLLERWHGPYAYGDTIYLTNADHMSGMWIVKDTMNARYTNRIDLLVDIGDKAVEGIGTIRKAI